jgi:hypothetical protein
MTDLLAIVGETDHAFADLREHSMNRIVLAGLAFVCAAVSAHYINPF